MQSRARRPAKQTGPVPQKSDLNQWPSPTNITTFVRCLRLLDLDTLVDWPGITDSIFASKSAQQNLQARIKAVEWSLYRLFEIYDPKETQTKIRPFFPPLAPLQSLNLRAALYRALTELKKHGVLGRDVVLRKTMLDECKGEKFEEVLSTLALVVLRKVCRSHHPGLDVNQIDHIPRERLVPLILAHRQSLQQSLQQRREISQRTEDYSAKLESAQTDLRRRMEEAQKGFQPVDEKDLRHLSDVVRSGWVGDDRWCNILLEGRTHAASPLLQKSFESTWTVSTDHTPTPEARYSDLAAELDERIGVQENRLKKWKTFYASLKNTRGGRLQARKTHEPAHNPSSLRIDRHKELLLDSLQTQQAAKERLEPYHASVLRNMREELAVLNSFAPTAKALAAEQDQDHIPSSQPEALDSTPNSVANHETAGFQDHSKISSSAQEDIPAVTAIGCEHTRDIIMNEEMQQEHTKFSAHVAAGEADMSLGSGGSFQDVESTGVPSSPPAGLTTLDDTPCFLQLGEEEKADALLQSKHGSMSMLHERTRASLLPFTMNLSSPDVHDDPTADDESDTSQVLPPLPEITAPRGTLLERTRQSMSLLPNPPSKSKASRQSSVKQSRFSEIFPVNQFERPSTAQTQQYGAWSPRSGSSTPRDKLFSDEADYASVFKSRPRIAVSPSLSPERSNLGLDSMLANGVDDLDLEDNDDTPSRGPRRNE